MPVSVFFGTIVALFTVALRVLFMISSPQGVDNFYTEVINAVDPVTNQSPFNVKHITPSCTDCDMNGVGDRCPHKEPLDLPFWKTEEDDREVQLIFGSRKALYDQEVRGMAKNVGTMALDSIAIASLENSVPFTPPPNYSVPWAVMAVDPALGGENELAMVCVYPYRGMLVIACMDSMLLTQDHIRDQEEEFLLSNIRALRDLPHMRDTVIVFAAEHTGNAEPSHMYDIMRTGLVGRYHLYYRDAARTKIGLNTDPETKMQQLSSMAHWLRRDSCAYDARFLCAAPRLARSGFDARELAQMKREQFHKQLRNLRLVSNPSENPHHKEKLVWTGKANAMGKNVRFQNDDIASAFGMAANLTEMILDGRATYRYI